MSDKSRDVARPPAGRAFTDAERELARQIAREALIPGEQALRDLHRLWRGRP